MMLQRFTGLLFFTVSCLSFTSAQVLKKIDSLQALLAQHTGSDSTRVNLLNQIGFEYWTIDPASSEKYGQEALALSHQLSFERGTAMAHRVIGVSHWSRGDFFKALSHLFESQKKYRSLSDALGEANSTMNIGMVYADQRDFGKALEQFQGAILLFEKLNRLDRIGITCNKIASLYLDKRDFVKSKEYIDRALAIHHQINFSFGIMEITNRLGLWHRELKNYDSALYHLSNSLALAEVNNDQEHTVKNLENLASVWILKEQFEKAKTLLDQAYPIAVNGHYKKWLRDILKDYRDVFTARGDYQKALNFTLQYEALKDSIFSEEKASQIASLELEYKTAQQQQAIKLREQQILVLEQQSKLKNTILLVMVLGGLALLAVMYLALKNQRLQLKQKQWAHERDQELSKIALENARLRELELSQSIEFKNKELASYTINFIQKNELIENIREKLDQLKNMHPISGKDLSGLYSLLQQGPSIDRDWEDFKRTFENVHPNFFGRLLEHRSDLTSSELRLCALIGLNMSIKESAAVLGISPDSVKMARHRLRKRLAIDQEKNLTDFIIGLTKR